MKCTPAEYWYDVIGLDHPDYYDEDVVRWFLSMYVFPQFPQMGKKSVLLDILSRKETVN